MPFNQKLQKFNAKINTVTIGSGDKTVTIGGDSTYPFYSFDAPSENAPKIGVEISDMGLDIHTKKCTAEGSQGRELIQVRQHGVESLATAP